MSDTSTRHCSGCVSCMSGCSWRDEGKALTHYQCLLGFWLPTECFTSLSASFIFFSSHWAFLWVTNMSLRLANCCSKRVRGNTQMMGIAASRALFFTPYQENILFTGLRSLIHGPYIAYGPMVWCQDNQRNTSFHSADVGALKGEAVLISARLEMALPCLLCLW